MAEPEELGDGPDPEPGPTKTTTRCVMPEEVGDEHAAVHPRARGTGRRVHGSAVLKAFQAIAACAAALTGVINHEGASVILDTRSRIAVPEANGPSTGRSFCATEPGTVGDGMARAGRLDGRRGLDERPGAGGLHQLKTGHGKRIRGLASWAAEKVKAENDVYEAHRGRARFPRRKNTVDVLEIFSGCSIISMRASHWGFKAMQPYDIIFGQDLRVREQRRAVMEAIRKYKPRLVVIQFPCTMWSVLQNCTRREDPSILEGLRQADRPFLNFTRDIFNEQTSRGDHAMAENPSSAASWQETPILELRQRFWETTSNMCMFGMIGKGGQPLFKLVRWVATHPGLIAAMDRNCDHMHAHEPVAGGNAKTSAAYPQGVADAILGALWDIADDEDYGSSCLGTEVREVYCIRGARHGRAALEPHLGRRHGDPCTQEHERRLRGRRHGSLEPCKSPTWSPGGCCPSSWHTFQKPSGHARNSVTPCTDAR